MIEHHSTKDESGTLVGARSSPSRWLAFARYVRAGKSLMLARASFCAIVLMAVAILLLLGFDLQSNSPRFNKSPSLTFPSNATVHFLNFLTSRPFEGGKM